MTRLKNKIAIITGGARGIGREITERFLEHGATVVIVDVLKDDIEKTVNDFKKSYEHISGISADITNPEQVSAMVKSVKETHGKIDILVNNAGITRDTLLVRMSAADWQKVINVNLTGTFNCTQKVAKVMMRQRTGAIVNMASVIGIMGNVGQANYAASKGGIIAFTKSLARELGPRNIRANAIAPGFIQTPMTDSLPENVKAEYLSRIPLRKFGTTAAIADAALFLCSDDASYITGQTLVVDGGML